MPVAGGHVVLDRETRAEVGGLGIIPLGTLGRSYMFWRKDTGTVELVSDNAVGTDASIMRLAPRQSWRCGAREMHRVATGVLSIELPSRTC